MKQIAPHYFKEFKCIADKCKHNCCKEGWEIDIDKKTAEYYKNLPGELGEKLRKNMNFSDICSFILNENKTCPFLNENNLCSLYLTLGPDHMGQICTDHPRFFEWFENEKEAGIGLCCEEAARIILSNTEKFHTYEEEINEEGIGNYDKDLYNFLKNIRKNIINYLEKSDILFKKKLINILNYSNLIQEKIDNYDLNIIEINEENIKKILEKNSKKIQKNIEKNNEKFDKKIKENILNNILLYFSKLEYIKDSWPEYLKNNEKYINNYLEEKIIFEEKNPQIINYLKNISIYFIWRYFIKGTFDEEILSRIKFMIISNIILEFLFYSEWKNKNNFELNDAIEITRRYSEEVEYSDDNMNKIADDTYVLDYFSDDLLIYFLN